MTLYSTFSGMKSFPIENYQGTLKRLLARRLTFRKDRSWTKVLQEAVKTYNHTRSPTLDNLSPKEASKGDNIARLQGFYLKKRARKVRPYLKQKPAFHIGQYVKILLTNEKLRQRCDRKRFSEENYVISYITKTVPFTYRVKSLGKRAFYKEQLTPVLDPKLVKESLTNKRILTIMEKRKFPIKWLRSGKAVDFEIRYLVRTAYDDEKRFMTESEIKEFDNGAEMLNSFVN